MVMNMAIVANFIARNRGNVSDIISKDIQG